MKDKKIRIAILFGGKSAEHEVSIESAKNVYKALDKNKYDILLIGIDREGIWHSLSEKYLLASSLGHKQLEMDHYDKSLETMQQEKPHMKVSLLTLLENTDVVFPVLHGSYGEDGYMQGFLEIVGLPYVGSGVLGSAIGMDKDVTKRLLRDAELPVADFLVFRKEENIDIDLVEERLGLPLFVKPATLGSSIGVTKVKEKSNIRQAIKDAFQYDTKIILEQFIPGREVECSVLGNENPQASIPGEIIPHHEFYDYEAKYLDDEGASLKVPADLPEDVIKRVQESAVQVFKVLCLEGMARIDMFVHKDGGVYINEANTIPGFTMISMYPKLWEASGVEYKELIDRLVKLAIERYKTKQNLSLAVG